MRPPSRLIPTLDDKHLPGWLLPVAVMPGFGYVLYSSSNRARCFLVFLAIAFWGYTSIVNRREGRRLDAMAKARGAESICSFARSFDTRQTDTWVIRAAHQELQRWLHSLRPDFPVCATDALLADLRIDPDDVEDLALDIAARSGRSLDQAEHNPYYGKVYTVSDLVLFMNAQPRTASA